MSETKQTPKLELTLDNFQAIITQATTAAVEAAIGATRKPTEKEVRDLEQINKERAANAADVKAKIDADRAYQKVCLHCQDRNRDTSKTACVFVNQDFPNRPNRGQYLHCQGCGANIVPGVAPKGVDENNQPLAPPDFIYDTALFVKHMQMIRFE